MISESNGRISKNFMTGKVSKLNLYSRIEQVSVLPDLGIVLEAAH